MQNEQHTTTTYEISFGKLFSVRVATFSLPPPSRTPLSLSFWVVGLVSSPSDDTKKRDPVYYKRTTLNKTYSSSKKRCRDKNR